MPVPPNNPASSGSPAYRDEADTAASPPLPRVRVRSRPSEEAPSPTADAPGPDAGRTDYEVGYKKPPRDSQFQPGQSGNPRGRPKAAKDLNTLVRETMEAKITVRTASGETKMSRIEAVLHKTFELAMKGDHRALKLVISLCGSLVPEAEPLVTPSAQTEYLTAAEIAENEAFYAEFMN